MSIVVNSLELFLPWVNLPTLMFRKRRAQRKFTFLHNILNATYERKRFFITIVLSISCERKNANICWVTLQIYGNITP